MIVSDNVTERKKMDMERQMQNCRLIALDMDGTLLCSDKSLLPETARDIAAASDRGIEVVYCTGRSTAELAPYVDSLASMRYAVCTSGALVYDLWEKRCIHSAPIPIGTIQEVLRILGEDCGMYQFLTETEIVVRGCDVMHMADFHMGPYQPLFEKIARKVDSLYEETLQRTSIPKVNVFFRSMEDRMAAYEKVRHLPLMFAQADVTSLEMTAPGVSKAEGLRRLADLLGIPMEETAAIGDADNDRRMLEAVGLPIAMGNADEAIRAICRIVTADNDHNGVGEAIRAICEG